jgi:hypothetical protein
MRGANPIRESADLSSERHFRFEVEQRFCEPHEVRVAASRHNVEVLSEEVGSVKNGGDAADDHVFDTMTREDIADRGNIEVTRIALHFAAEFR